MAFGAQIVLALHIRLRAWPETLVPAYLVSRGWVLYRNVKFAHMPLWIGIEAMIGRLFGFRPLTLRLFSLGPALAAHAAVWRAGSVFQWRSSARVGAALFFLATFYLWDGNAVYPDVAIAALVIPAFMSLRRADTRGVTIAGVLLGVVVAIKQPAGLALVAAAVWLAANAPRSLGRFVVSAAIPPAVCAAVFAVTGNLREMLLWTVVVPLRDYRGRTNLAIGQGQVPFVVLGIVTLAVWFVMARKRRDGTRSLLLLLVLGFVGMAFPKFELVHLIAAVPLLAVAAGETFEIALESPGVLRLVAAIPALVVGLDAAFLATDTSSGEISFWSSKADDAIVDRLAALPPAPLYLYGPDQNLFVRSGRVPPDRLYANPDLWYQLRAEKLESRQIAVLRAHPETLVVSGGSGAVQTGDSGGRLEDLLSTNYRVRERWAYSLLLEPSSPARPIQ